MLLQALQPNGAQTGPRPAFDIARQALHVIAPSMHPMACHHMEGRLEADVEG